MKKMVTDDGLYDDDEVIIILKLVLTIREAYSIASKLQRLQEDNLVPIVDELVSKLEKKLIEEKSSKTRSVIYTCRYSSGYF